ncbi:Coatomer subunit delta [Mortierella alpina]|uniref:Coatomer subunit delta n=1 Tax=Mortierella alpina TaxID=64518 RepID=A0A9P6M460_MORAP|nr:Coatomer subunit delta [Mortierella alpina]
MRRDKTSRRLSFEVLELIFSLLNDYTLRFNAARVCRDWNVVARHLLNHTVTWTADRPGEHMAKPAALQRLENARALHIIEPADCPGMRQHLAFGCSNWKALLERLDTLANRDHNLGITDLKVQCHMSVKSLLLPLLGRLGFQLVQLRLENLFDPDAVVGTVLVLCPQLAHLYVSHSSGACFQTKTMYEGAQSTELPEKLRLRSLGLDGMAIEDAALFSLLVSCPNLGELKLTALKHAGNIVRRRDQSATPRQEHLVTFTEKFFRRLAAICPRISCLDVSTIGDSRSHEILGPTKQAMEEAFALFPCLTQTTLVGADTCPVIFEALDRCLRNTVTTLELTGQARTNVGSYLHAYLCHSPHLLHLKAPDVDVSNSCFDLEGILSPCGRYTYLRRTTTFHDAENPDVTGTRANTYGRASQRTIWACRNLRTLDFRCQRNQDSDTAENSRMIFSYLSKVCPQLEDLTLRRRWLSLSLHTGFCLLSRLQKLQRLVLITSRVNPLIERDLTWISKYMTTAQKVLMVALLLPHEDSKSSQIRSTTPFRNMPPAGPMDLKDSALPFTGRECQSTVRSDQAAGVDYIVGGVDMRDVGRVHDVFQHARQRFADSTCCWPQLQFLQVSSQESSSFPQQDANSIWRLASPRHVEVLHPHLIPLQQQRRPSSPANHYPHPTRAAHPPRHSTMVPATHLLIRKHTAKTPVVLAISVCTKSGKALISRQFREMTRSRIEGLIASFPKLTSTGQQHTTIETEHVRYVYQPLEELFIVLITNKQSNILQDIDTLQLVSRVVSSVCRPTDAREIDRNAFELLSSFDEIISLGYRENVNLAQVANISEMESHEEKIQEMIEKNKEREAKEELKRRAKMLDLQRKEQRKQMGGMGGGYGQGGMGMGGMGGYGQSSPMGFGGQSGMGGMGGMGGNQGYESPSTNMDDNVSKFSNPAPKAPVSKARGMQLGRKQNNTDLFESLRSEVEAVPAVQHQQAPIQSNFSAPPEPAFPMESVHVQIEEKITMVANRDGGLENMEVKGDLTLRVSDPTRAKISLALRHLEDPNIQFKTHPNVNKVLFNSEKTIAFRDSSKEFPLNTPTGVLRWRFISKDESSIPLSINCWPSPAGDGSSDVNIEYQLENEEMEFKNVNIIIPLPQGTSPTVGEVDGEYLVDPNQGVLIWQLPSIDSSNPSGSMEFNCQGEDTESFFPVSVQFDSERLICDVDVLSVTQVADGSSVPFSKQSILTPLEYSVV